MHILALKQDHAGLKDELKPTELSNMAVISENQLTSHCIPHIEPLGHQDYKAFRIYRTCHIKKAKILR